jgi:G:T/U-mismatch repair DNA glycosylase
MKEPDLSSYEPDILVRDLDVIFCGVNPAVTAAVAGHNFSSRSNRFWTVLQLAGFTDCPPSAARGKTPARVSMRPDRCRRPADKTCHRCTG